MPDRTIEWTGINQRFQEVAPGEYAREVYTRGLWDTAVARGEAFIVTSARLTTDVTNTHIVAVITNPADSGKVVTVAQVVATIAPDTMVVGSVELEPRFREALHHGRARRRCSQRADNRVGEVTHDRQHAQERGHGSRLGFVLSIDPADRYQPCTRPSLVRHQLAPVRPGGCVPEDARTRSAAATVSVRLVSVTHARQGDDHRPERSRTRG